MSEQGGEGSGVASPWLHVAMWALGCQTVNREARNPDFYVNPLVFKCWYNLKTRYPTSPPAIFQQAKIKTHRGHSGKHAIFLRLLTK